MKKKILAIIPCRSGSKSLKNKNILKIFNKPLVYYSIFFAKKCKFIDRVIVSTDSKKYKKICEKYGAEVPFLRPKRISKDNSLDVDCFKHAISWLKVNYNYNPDIIINCIGILIKESDIDPENSIFLNSYLPHRLTRLSDKIDAKLIHISTDCVFSGDKKEQYDEADEKDGRGIYAKTKGLGEVINDKHLTLRTSVVGPELKEDGEELFHWFMGQSGVVSGYTKAIWSGVTTIELAKAVECSIRKDITGLHHITNNSSISKYDLLILFQKHMKKNIQIY